MRPTDYFYRKRGARLGLEIADLHHVSKRAVVEVELPASLGSAHIAAWPRPQGRLLFGAHSYIRSGEIHGVASIGRFCSIGRRVTLGLDARAHPSRWASTSVELCHDYRSPGGVVVIGHDTWIGEGAMIMAGVTIGNGAIIGSGTVVTRDVAPYQIVVGSPARVVRMRFDPEVCAALEASQWWDKPLPRLHRLDYGDPLRFSSQAALEPAVEYAVATIAQRRIRLRQR